jgi:hypothetical protein
MNPACVNGKIALANKALDEAYAQQSYQKQRYRSCRQARLLSRQDSTSRSLQVVDFTLDLRDPDQLEVLLGFQVFNFGSRLLDCGPEVVMRGLNRG